MNTSTKKWLIAAGSFVVIGLIIFAVVMTVCHWDFFRLSTDQFETSTYEIKEDFTNININTETADILFEASDDNTCKVTCYEEKNSKHSVNVQDDTLTVTLTDDREWFEHIGVSLHSPKITVYLPKTEYASLVIKVSTGDIQLEKCDANELDIHTDTGDVTGSLLSSKVFIVHSDTGDIDVPETTSGGKCKITTATGDIRIEILDK